MSRFSRGGPIAVRVIVAAGIGAVMAISIGIYTKWLYAPASGWIAAAVVFLLWTWLVIAPMDPAQTESHATREDPTRGVTDTFILAASVASLLGVAFLFTAGSAKDEQADLAGLLGAGSVAAAWCLVHTLFTLRYALLYYTGSDRGIDFNQSDEPAYADFAYLAFTIGMTYQVSDTDLKSRAIRATALRQGLLSYLLGAIILAVVVNVVAGLAH